MDRMFFFDNKQSEPKTKHIVFGSLCTPDEKPKCIFRQILRNFPKKMPIEYQHFAFYYISPNFNHP